MSGNKKSLILDLPIELQTRILSHLNFEWQSLAAHVCSLWASIIYTAPEPQQMRYYRALQYGGAIASNKWKIHALFAEARRHRETLYILIDVGKGVLEGVLLPAGGPTQRDPIDNILSWPFLDEPIFKRVRPNELSKKTAQEREEDIEEQRPIYPQRQTEDPSSEFQISVRLSPKFGYNSPSHTNLKWTLLPSDFFGSYSIYAAPRDKTEAKDSSESPEEWLTGSLTIRRILEALAMKLKNEYTSTKFGRECPSPDPCYEAGEICYHEHPRLNGKKMLFSIIVNRVLPGGGWNLIFGERTLSQHFFDQMKFRMRNYDDSWYALSRHKDYNVYQ